MCVSWFRAAIWGLTFFALAVFVNWPRDIGKGRDYFVRLGFPMEIAFWKGGKLEDFSILSLIVDVTVWMTVVLLIPILLSLRRRPRHEKRG